VLNGNDFTVTKLRASDGAALGTFQVGNAPDAIVFDGANIWVANYDDSTVQKL
jgi:DNA-binding beta-propeller fold protein YncE